MIKWRNLKILKNFLKPIRNIRQTQFCKILLLTLTFFQKTLLPSKVPKEKKFISWIPCIRKKISHTNLCIRAVFFRIKVVSDFHFGQFSTLRIEWLGQTSEFYRKGWMVRILVFIFFQPLLGLVSSPHSLFIVHST